MSTLSAKDKIGKSTWFDLPASDIVNFRSFYEGLFNWEFLLLKDAPLQDYWVIKAGTDLIGGVRKTPPHKPTEHAPVLYFTVDNLDIYSKRIKELGGKLVGSRVDLGKGGAYQWFRDREENLVALWAPEEER